VPVWLSVAAAGLALVGAVGAAYSVFRERALTATLEAFRLGNQELRDLYESERTARHHQEQRGALAMAEQEQNCARQLAQQGEKIAHLSGQVETLQSGIVAALVNELREALVDAVHAALNTPERRAAS